MSAPQTDIEKQTRRHRWPLIGMALVVIFGTFLIVFWLFEEAAQTEQPSGDVPTGSADVEQAPRTTSPPSETPVQPQTPPAAAPQ